MRNKVFIVEAFILREYLMSDFCNISLPLTVNIKKEMMNYDMPSSFDKVLSPPGLAIFIGSLLNEPNSKHDKKKQHCRNT